MSDSAIRALCGFLLGVVAPLGLLLFLRCLAGDSMSWNQYPRVENKKEKDE